MTDKAVILSIDTATEVCSVCLSKGAEILIARSSTTQNHAADLHPFIMDILKETQLTPANINAIAVSSGPGSYTGLRIGWAAAKGLCYALNIPLISVDTLQALARGLQQALPHQAYYMPMIDARRMEVYTALYGQQLDIILATHSLVFNDEVKTRINYPSVYGGSGAAKAQAYMPSGSIFLEGIKSSAIFMALAGYSKYMNGQFEDLAYSEPNYLKEAKITESKK